MNSAIDAYTFADTNGLKYKRCRIGVSIYQDKDRLQTFEIAHSWAALYHAQPTKMPKKDRLIRVWRWEPKP